MVQSSDKNKDPTHGADFVGQSMIFPLRIEKFASVSFNVCECECVCVFDFTEESQPR